jgi:tripartite-type tricarboxylate transporter receptor subunit TctC
MTLPIKPLMATPTAWRNACATATGPTAGAIALALAGLAALATADTARAQDFYAGKTVTMIVANTPSSGFDAYGRLLARNMPRYIPGSPNIIVQHMPGAGGAKANEYTALIAPKDGTALTITMPGSILLPLLQGRQKFRYDPTKLAFIGNADSGTRVCILAAKSGVKTFEDLLAKPVTVGATAPGGSLYDYARFKQVLLGAKFRIVTGYPGPGDILIAIERGELDSICGLDISTLKTLRPTWVGSKDYNTVIQVTSAKDKSSAELDKIGVPTIWKFIPADKLPVVELIVKQQAFHRPFFAPGETPPAQLAVLRKAFLSALKDPAALAEAEKQNLALDPSSGEEVAAAVKSMFDAPQSLVDAMAKATQPPPG